MFGYGSLIWNPTIRYLERRSRPRAGLAPAVLPLHPGRARHAGQSGPAARHGQAGGSCTGAAFRLDPDILAEELALLWRREMLTGAYVPRWLPMQALDGGVFGHGLLFTINHSLAHELFAGELDRPRKSSAASPPPAARWAVPATIMFQTRDGLRELGIEDRGDGGAGRGGQRLPGRANEARPGTRTCGHRWGSSAPGPAGLFLAHLLHRVGISAVNLESRSRHDVESTIRAGVLEHWVVELMRDLGIGETDDAGGAFPHRHHPAMESFERHHLDIEGLTGGKRVAVYPQHEVLRDLIAGRLAQGGEIVFGVGDTTIAGIDTDTPRIELPPRRRRRRARPCIATTLSAPTASTAPAAARSPPPRARSIRRYTRSAGSASSPRRRCPGTS